LFDKPPLRELTPVAYPKAIAYKKIRVSDMIPPSPSLEKWKSVKPMRILSIKHS